MKNYILGFIALALAVFSGTAEAQFADLTLSTGKMPSLTMMAKADLPKEVAEFQEISTFAATPAELGIKTTASVEENLRRSAAISEPTKVKTLPLIKYNQSWSWPGGTVESLRRHLVQTHDISPEIAAGMSYNELHAAHSSDHEGQLSPEYKQSYQLVDSQPAVEDQLAGVFDNQQNCPGGYCPSGTVYSYSNSYSNSCNSPNSVYSGNCSSNACNGNYSYTNSYQSGNARRGLFGGGGLFRGRIFNGRRGGLFRGGLFRGGCGR